MQACFEELGSRGVLDDQGLGGSSAEAVARPEARRVTGEEEAVPDEDITASRSFTPVSRIQIPETVIPVASIRIGQITDDTSLSNGFPFDDSKPAPASKNIAQPSPRERISSNKYRRPEITDESHCDHYVKLSLGFRFKSQDACSEINTSPSPDLDIPSLSNLPPISEAGKEKRHSAERGSSPSSKNEDSRNFPQGRFTNTSSSSSSRKEACPSATKYQVCSVQLPANPNMRRARTINTNNISCRYSYVAGILPPQGC